MDNERTGADIAAGEPPLSPDFAGRVLRRVDAERRWRRMRRGLLAGAGIAAVVCGLVVYQSRPDSHAPRAAVNPSVAADADGLSRAGLELPQNQDAEARQSMEGYFFPDLKPLAEFNSGYDPVSSEDLSDR